MTDTAHPAPLYILSSYMSPTVMGLIRSAMVIGALFIAALSFIIPMLTGEKDKLITYTLLGVAGFDLLMAVALPHFLANRASPLRYEMYRDHMAIRLGASDEKPLARVNYDEIARVEELANLPQKDREAGLTGVVVYLNAAREDVVRLPYYGTLNGPALTIKGLRQEDSPLARIKELVEKSKPA